MTAMTATLVASHPPGLAARSATYATATRILLQEIDIVLRPGEVVAVIGPNGAGKSTLLKLLAGDLVPTGGDILLDGRPLSRFSAHDLSLRRAVLPQQTILQFAFSAREVVEMGRAPHRERRGSRVAERIVVAAMERTETRSLESRSYPTMSGGEQGRVSLARVLAQDAPILFLDEPTAALDLRHQGLVMEIARELASQGASVLAVLHDLNLAAAYADRLAVLCDGHLVANDEPWAVLTERLLSDVYGCPIAVCPHPVRGCPLVMPLPKATPARAVAREVIAG